MKNKFKESDIVVKKENVRYIIVSDENGNLYKEVLMTFKKEIGDEDDYELIGTSIT